MSSTALGAENKKKESIIFISDAHEKFYYEKLKEVRYQDVYHKGEFIMCRIIVIANQKGGVGKTTTTSNLGIGLVECGKMLKKGGYKIKVLNTINFAKSMHYNPFAYIRSEKDILKLVNTIIVNTKGEGQQSGEDFWVKAEKLYYTALISYIWYEAPEEEQNFAMLIDMIDASEAREDDENFKNAVDLLFEELEADNPKGQDFSLCDGGNL